MGPFCVCVSDGAFVFALFRVLGNQDATQYNDREKKGWDLHDAPLKSSRLCQDYQRVKPVRSADVPFSSDRTADPLKQVFQAQKQAPSTLLDSHRLRYSGSSRRKYSKRTWP